MTGARYQLRVHRRYEYETRTRTVEDAYEFDSKRDALYLAEHERLAASVDLASAEMLTEVTVMVYDCETGRFAYYQNGRAATRVNWVDMAEE